MYILIWEWEWVSISVNMYVWVSKFFGGGKYLFYFTFLMISIDSSFLINILFNDLIINIKKQERKRKELRKV